MKKVAVKKSTKPMKKYMTGGMANPNKTVTVNTTPTPYKGGISKAPAAASTTPTKYTGGKQTPPTGATPGKKISSSTTFSKSPTNQANRGLMKKGGSMPKAMYGKTMMKKGGATKAKKK
jgi:hypothetical protein